MPHTPQDADTPHTHGAGLHAGEQAARRQRSSAQNDTTRQYEADRALYDEVHWCLLKMDAVYGAFVELDTATTTDTLLTLGSVLDDYRADIQRLLEDWWEEQQP